MQSLALQIQALAGSANNTEMSDWANEGAKEIINLLPGKLLQRCKDFTTLDTSPNSLTSIDTRGKILSIIRSDGTVNQIASYIKSKFNGALTDSTSMHFATVGSPKWTIYGDNLYVYPAPTDAQPAYIEHIQFPNLDVSAVSTIAKFPDEAEYLVVLYSACKVLHNKMNEKSASLPSDLSVPVIAVISTSLPSYTAPTAFVMPVAPAGVDVDFSEVGTIESFVSPVFTVPTLATIAAMDLPSIPVAPTMSEKSVTITGTTPSYLPPSLSLEAVPTLVEPSYVAPVLSLEASPTITSLTISSTIPVAPALDSTSIDTSGLTNPTFTAPVMNAPDWNDTNTWITTEEDSEMSAARVQEINGKISEFSARMNEAQAQFTKESSILQKDLQVAMQNASTFEQGKLSKYGAELQSYQASVASEVQEWQLDYTKQITIWESKKQSALQAYQSDMQNNLNVFNKENTTYQADIQIWTAKRQTQLQDYGSTIQNNLNVFNKEVTEYQTKFQKDTQDAQLAESKEGRDLQKYSQEVQTYQAQVNTEVQRWTNETFGKVFQEWTQRYQGKLQEYGNDLQVETGRVTASVNDYQAKLGKALQTYQAETGYDLSKYQAETQAQSQKYTNDLQQNTSTFTNNLQKYSSEIQKVSTDNQSALAVFGQALADYGAKIQKHSTDYQWLQGQYAALKQDYNQGIQILIGGGNPPQQGGK
jgi:hypothetical protein